MNYTITCLTLRLSFQKSSLVLSEDELLAESAPEYPSPVSVLDNAVYTDESPSPVKHTPTLMKGAAFPSYFVKKLKAHSHKQI